MNNTNFLLQLLSTVGATLDRATEMSPFLLSISGLGVLHLLFF